jgi:hypothetical protein
MEKIESLRDQKLQVDKLNDDSESTQSPSPATQLADLLYKAYIEIDALKLEQRLNGSIDLAASVKDLVDSVKKLIHLYSLYYAKQLEAPSVESDLVVFQIQKCWMKIDKYLTRNSDSLP